MLPGGFNTRGYRPVSEIVKPGHYTSTSSASSSEIDSLNHWYEDLQQYERNIDEMATASLDQNFKEELQHVDQWFRFLSEAERTATIFSLLQHSSPVQIRFFINLLQQMGKRDSIHTVLMTPNPDQTDMQSQFAGALAKAEMEASQRLMSVLPYKTGQVVARPPPTSARRQVDRHSFALGDTEDYTRQFIAANGNTTSSSGGGGNVNNVRYNGRPASQTYSANTLLTPNTFNTSGGSGGGNNSSSNNNRPRSVIEGDTSTLFTTPWTNNASVTSSRRPMSVVGNIGDRGSGSGLLGAERPKSADISNWSFTTGMETMMETTNNNNNAFPSPWNLGLDADIDFNTLTLQSTYARGNRNGSNNNNNNNASSMRKHIPNTVPENDETIATTTFKAPGSSSSSLSRPTSPRPVSSSSTPFNNQHQHHHHQRKHFIPPPGMEKQYNQFLSPSDHHLGTTSSSSSSTSLDTTGINDLQQLQHLHLHNNNNNNNNESNDSSLLMHRRMPSNTSSRTGNLQSTSPSLSHNNTTTSTTVTATTASTSTNLPTASKEKKLEVIDMQLLQDVPAWFRSLRLHKYNSIFEPMKWQDIIKLTDAELEEKGVAALGARRKMLKVFENIKQHCDENVN
ncbi:unnamed protein product [Cunninghamella echinulata]